MTKEEIMNLGFEELESRSNAIAAETAEADAEKLDALSAELDLIEERKRVLKEEVEKRKKDAEAVASGKGKTIKTRKDEHKMTDMEIRNSHEYIEAFAKYIKTGNPTECRTLLSDNVTGGVVPVPEFVYDIVKTAWEREGIMSRVRKAYLKGNLQVGFEISGTAAQIHAEGASAVSEETLVLGTVSLIPESIKKWISISDEVYDLRGEAFLRYIYDELTYRIAKKAADELIAKIVASPATSTTTAPAVPVMTSTQVSVGLVAQAIAQLSDEAVNPVVIMNKLTYANFKAAQYAAGYPIDPFEGCEVLFNNTITAFNTATTGVTYAIVGDLGQGALANFPNGEEIQFKFDDMTDMTKDLIRVLGRKYVALGVVAPNAFVKVVH